MKQKTQVYDYSLFIKGLFGRNRSIKFDSFRLIENCLEKQSVEEIKQLAEEKLIKLKPKGSYFSRWQNILQRLKTIAAYELKRLKLLLDMITRFFLKRGQHERKVRDM